MLIISHTDVNHTGTGNSPQNTQTYMKNVEKKRFICAKKIAKLRPHQMTGVSQRASRAVAMERQNSNKQSSVYL